MFTTTATTAEEQRFIPVIDFTLIEEIANNSKSSVGMILLEMFLTHLKNSDNNSESAIYFDFTNYNDP